MHGGGQRCCFERCAGMLAVEETGFRQDRPGCARLVERGAMTGVPVAGMSHRVQEPERLDEHQRQRQKAGENAVSVQLAEAVHGVAVKIGLR